MGHSPAHEDESAEGSLLAGNGGLNRVLKNGD